MNRSLLVYIAGPISKGDLRQNIKQACDAGLELIKAGFSVHIPHLTCYSGQRYDGAGCLPEVLPEGTTHKDWYGLSIEQVTRCDAVLRLPGESTGADMEVKAARENGIPIFLNIAAVLNWSKYYSDDGYEVERLEMERQGRKAMTNE